MKLRLALAVAGALTAALLGGLSSRAGGGTLTVTPSPVVLGSTFTLAGCGYAGDTVSFELTGPRKSAIHYFTSGEPLADGCFSDQWTAWWGVAGDYQITSYFRDSRGASHKAGVVKFTVTD